MYKYLSSRELLSRCRVATLEVMQPPPFSESVPPLAVSLLKISFLFYLNRDPRPKQTNKSDSETLRGQNVRDFETANTVQKRDLVTHRKSSDQDSRSVPGTIYHPYFEGIAKAFEAGLDGGAWFSASIVYK